MLMPRHFAAIILTLALSGCTEKTPPGAAANPNTGATIELEKKCLLLTEEINTQSNRADLAIAEHEKEIESNAPLRRTIDSLVADKNTAQGYIETIRKEMEGHERAKRKALKDLKELRAGQANEHEARLTSQAREHKDQIRTLETTINKSQAEQKRLRDLVATRARENEISRATQTREHEEQVGALEATIGSLEARVKALEAKVKSLGPKPANVTPNAQ